MSGFTVSMKMEIRELEKEIKDTKKRAKKAIRTGVTKSGRVVVRQIKGKLKASRRTKLLWKSVSSVVRSYREGMVAVAVAGVRKGFRQTVAIPPNKVFILVGRKGLGKGAKGGKVIKPRKPLARHLQQIVNPEKYLHLVERGFTRADGKHFPGQFPIRDGFNAAKAEAERILADEIRAGLEGQSSK